MKKFLFIELSDKTDDAKPAGFTKKGIFTIFIITVILLFLSYLVLQRYKVENQSTLILSLIFSIILVFISFYILLLPLSRMLNKRISQATNPKFVAGAVLILSILLLLILNFFN